MRGYDFVNFDDPDYVSANPHVRQGITSDGVAWAFRSTEAANWFPVTRLSHILDVQLFGLDAGWHHQVNVLLHAMAALLLFAFLCRATSAQWPSALVAFLFALHPLHVESVAWIAERKDTLAALFWFLALWSYVRYAEKKQWGWYWLTLGAFSMGLMSKPMIVTLPFVMLLIDWWPLRRRLGVSLLYEKIPFFAMTIVSGAVTYATQAASGATGALAVPFALRLENALVSYFIYIAKMFWPTALAVFYPYPAQVSPLLAGCAAAAILGISFLAVRSRPYLAVGCFWYLGTLVPVIGLIQVGAQARADRYTYVPMVGLFMAAAWGLAEIADRWPAWKNAVVAGGVAACVSCAVLTYVQVGYWRDSESLFKHALDSTERNDIAEHNLGAFLLTIPGRSPEAMEHLEASLKINPGSAKVHTDLGTALSNLPGRLPDAVQEYRAALRIAPGLAVTHNNLGNTLAKLDRLPEAVDEYRVALRIDQLYAEAHNNLGSALARLGHRPEAVAEFQEALRLRPDYPEALQNLKTDPAEVEYNEGLSLARAGQRKEAASHFEAALKLNPNYPEAHNNLGVVLAGSPEAIRHFEEALRLRPDYADAHVNLAVALSGMPGRLNDAVHHLQEAQRIKPDPEVQKMLDRLTR